MIQEQRIRIDGLALKRAIRSRGYTCKLVSKGIGLNEATLSNCIHRGWVSPSTMDLLRDRYHIDESEYLAFGQTVEPRRVLGLTQSAEEPATLSPLMARLIHDACKAAIMDTLRELAGVAAR